MAYQSIGLGSSADDGTGDSLRVGGDKVNDNFSEIYTLLGTGTALTSGMSSSASVVTLTAPSIATSIAPNSSDGASLGTASLEWSDLYIADGGIIYFGDDQEITLTHVADDGLILKHVGTGDGKEPSFSFHAGDNDIAINDVLGSIFLKAPDEGAGTDAILVAAGMEAVSEGDFSSSNNATKLSFLTAASEAASEKMSLSSAGLLTIADDLMIKDGGTIGVSSDADSMTIASTGIVTFSQIPSVPINTIEISTQTRGAFLVMDRSDGFGSDAGDNIIDETDSDNMLMENVTSWVTSGFTIRDSFGNHLQTVNGVS